MSVSRRDFMKLLGLGGAAAAAPPLLSARGHEALLGLGSASTGSPHATPGALQLDSNENPNGPGPAALRALREAVPLANRYPEDAYERLEQALATALKVPAEALLTTCGSEELLRACVLAFTAPDRPLVTAAPTFELPAHLAARLGRPVVALPLDASLRLNLDAMAAKAKGAGLVFVCNPNNPTGTVHGAKAIAGFVEAIRAASPETVILLDEAYHDYVEDSAYATAIPLALQHPNVLVSRTFSKAHGMAGLRCGYGIAQPQVLRALQTYRLGAGVTQLTAAAASASIGDLAHIAAERKANRAARAYAEGLFRDWGFAMAASEANFLMVDVRRDARDFQQACFAQGVKVGRPFPPLTTHARISIGTLDEMRKAGEVFRKLLKG